MNEALRTRAGLFTGSLSVAAMLLLAACQPIVDPAMLPAPSGGATPEATAEAVEAPVEPAAEAEPTADAEPAAEAEPATEAAGEAAEEPSLEVDPAQATVNTRSLRVRQEPNEASEQIASIKEGETYDVLGISSDGNWIQLALPEVEGEQGWVSTSFVTLQGDITNIETTAVIDAEATTPGASESEAEVSEAEEPEASEAETSEAEASEAETPEAETPEATPTPEPEGEAAAAPEGEAEATPEAESESEVEATVPAESEEEAAATPVAEEEAEATATPTSQQEEGGAGIEIVDGVVQPAPGYALVVIDGTDALRVRSAPTTEEDNKVGNVRNGEAYLVLEVSPDGEWVRIDVPALNLEDGGWVSADFVVIGE